MSETEHDVARVRGSLPAARANARTVAALTANPGCTRRRVLDAAAVATWKLVERLGHESNRGQSPFAIVTGDRFEYRLKKGSSYKLLVEALSKFVEFDIDNLRVENLAAGIRAPVGEPRLLARAAKTETELRAIVTGAPEANDLLDHPVLVFDLAGTPVFLEPDGLACRVDGQLELIEIKSYAIIDDQADPDKLSSTAGQAAVYLLALRATLERMGLSPDLVRPSVILVAPRNFGRSPTAHRVPLKKKVMALERVLRAVPKTGQVLASLPEGFTLDVDPGGHLAGSRRQKAHADAVTQLPMLYVPECLNRCDMAQFCRQQAVEGSDPSLLGRPARDGLAGVDSLEAALSLARDQAEVPDGLEDAAEGLKRAYDAIERARARAASSLSKRRVVRRKRTKKSGGGNR